LQDDPDITVARTLMLRWPDVVRVFTDGVMGAVEAVPYHNLVAAGIA
jgi:hypothetical protein